MINHRTSITKFALKIRPVGQQPLQCIPPQPPCCPYPPYGSCGWPYPNYPCNPYGCPVQQQCSCCPCQNRERRPIIIKTDTRPYYREYRSTHRRARRSRSAKRSKSNDRSTYDTNYAKYGRGSKSVADYSYDRTRSRSHSSGSPDRRRKSRKSRMHRRKTERKSTVDNGNDHHKTKSLIMKRYMEDSERGGKRKDGTTEVMGAQIDREPEVLMSANKLKYKS
jgi:hypothetical protein